MEQFILKQSVVSMSFVTVSHSTEKPEYLLFKKEPSCLFKACFFWLREVLDLF